MSSPAFHQSGLLLLFFVRVVLHFLRFLVLLGNIWDGPSLKSTLLIVPVKGNGTW